MIIDAHVHIGEAKPDKEWVWAAWPGQPRFGITAEQIIEKMDACKPRIDKALVFGLFSLAAESPEQMKEENDYILKMVNKYPDRLIGAGVVDPSWGDKAIKELHRFTKAGLRVVKIRFSSMHYHANSKAGQKVFSEIEKLGALPICHSDWTHYSNPLVIGDLAGMYPDLKMVMQHFGEYLSEDALSVCRRLGNVYVDTSALVHPKNIVTFMDEVSEDRILYASDCLSIRGGLQPQDALNRVLCLDLPKKREEKILGSNALELFKSVGVQL
ncbi:MAG: amidohydrolase family protein [Candidatus Bathyarchaeota archaeon]|nr:amidohydrolase family protein [Candidatus Bathyarchaeota archaeon]